jgi:voltage-gated potassium channel Kch
MFGTVEQLWADQYPPSGPRKHSLLEKLVLTPIILTRILSLDNIRPQKPDLLRHQFMDFYVLGWATILCLNIMLRGYWPAVSCALAAYRLYDIVTYRLYFLLVKSQNRPWTRSLLRRSILIVVINFFEVVIAFATLYGVLNGVTDASNMPIRTAMTAIYFSLLTMTTVGYGDFVPRTDLMRFIVVLQVVSSFLLLTFIVPALVSLLSAEIVKTAESEGKAPIASEGDPAIQ